MFNTTQQRVLTTSDVTSDVINLTRYVDAIRRQLDIDWPSVEWRDLRKPLYSLLGARLFVASEISSSSGNGADADCIPPSIDRQAAFWRAHYRPDADERHFVARATELEHREYDS